MTARKRTPAKPAGKAWTCPECDAEGVEPNAEAAAQAWIDHWNATHQVVPW